MKSAYTVVDHDDRPLWFPMLCPVWAGICQGHFEYGRGVACKVIRQEVSCETWTAPQVMMGGEP